MTYFSNGAGVSIWTICGKEKKTKVNLKNVGQEKSLKSKSDFILFFLTYGTTALVQELDEPLLTCHLPW